MTLINIAASVIYTEGAPLREKIQTNTLAIIFLVILYNSPSGLVFYWILNNIFSLVKNIVKSSAHPWKILYFVVEIIFIVSTIYVFIDTKDGTHKTFACVWTVLFSCAPIIFKILINTRAKKFLKEIHPIWIFYLLSSAFFVMMTIYAIRYTKSGPHKIFFLCWTIFAVLIPPVFSRFAKQRLCKLLASYKMSANAGLLIASCVCLWLLCGFVLPSSTIATSPEEFSFLGNTDSPLSYVLSSLLFFFGLFVFWPILIYNMFGGNNKVRHAMPPIFFVIAVCAVANAFWFKHNYGTVSVFFSLDDISVLSSRSPFFVLFPIVFMAVIIAIFFAAEKSKKQAILTFALVAVSLGELSLGAIKTKQIKDGFNRAIAEKNINATSQIASGKLEPQYHFSKDKENVLVLFLDRAIPTFFPYILEQFPELKKSYDGFIFYPNCLSFADYTISGAPALMGGYDYTVDEINKRSDTLLKDKHNEAILVMPTLFNEAGFETSIYAPPNLNYSVLPVPKEFNVARIIPRSTLLGYRYKTKHIESGFMNDSDCYAGIRHFSVMQILYPPARLIFSNGTMYYRVKKEVSLDEFVNAYGELFYLNENFDIEAKHPTFNMIYNLTPHEYTTLREGYVPGEINNEHPAAGTGTYEYIDGTEAGNNNDFQGYHANAASHLQVAKFLDALKENGIYDNTRIIIVADHGRAISLPTFTNFENNKDAAALNPLLLFKDFDAHGEVRTDLSLKTNADTPYLATKDILPDAKNPFTGKRIQNSDDFASFNVCIVPDWKADNHLNKTQFEFTARYNVRDNIFDEANWRKTKEAE